MLWPASKMTDMVIGLDFHAVLIPPGTRQRIANIGDADLLFLAVCTPRFTRAAYEDLEPG